MKLSLTGMGTTKLNNIDEMYPGQSILLQTGQLVQYGAGIFGYNTIPLLVKKKIESIIEETLNNENYLKDGENTIDISRYVKEYIYTSDDYIKFKNDKIFILENLLNNVKSFDQEGKVVNIKLSVEQKEIVLKQYAESFETSIKEYIENNPDEFEDMFIANNTSQFEKLFPKTYVESLKEQAVSRFKNENVMEAVRYGLAYPDNMKSAVTRQFVNNDKYKTLLVFNNNKNFKLI